MITLFLCTLLLCTFIIKAQLTPNRGTISCGQTVSGSIARRQTVYYTVVITENHNQIGFEGCNSAFDINLRFYSGNTLIQQAGCNPAATDLLTNSGVTAGGSYTIGITGSRPPEFGSYNVELICPQSNPTTTLAPVTQTPTPSPITSIPTPSPVPVPTPLPTPSPTDVPTATQSCGRHRKEWGSLTTQEQQLYVDGFKQLADQGVIQQLSQYHDVNFGPLHNNAQFLPWHRQFIFHLESLIRDLGGQFTCFAMPYWDWTNEPSQRDVRRGRATTQLERTDNNMGGDPNGACISSGAFRNGQYNPYGTSCLSRDIDYDRDSSCDFYSPSEVMNEIDATSLYSSFRPSFEGTPHALPHNCIGQNMARGYSPDDPYFYLHHCYVDYVWALWQDCNNYDSVPIGSVTSNMYNGNLNTDLPGFPGVSAGSVLDMGSMGVSYEKGPFWTNAQVDSQQNCGASSDPVNPTWFKTTTRRRLKDKNGGQDEDDDSKSISRKIYRELKDEGYSRKELVRLWSIKTCEYEHKQMGNICIMPEYFEDCSNMKINKKTNDIDITLEELLSKDGLIKCMKETRVRFYEWAKLTNTLKKLCDGCYDRFCDKSILRQKCNNDNNKDKEAVNPLIVNPINIRNNNGDEFMDIIYKYNKIWILIGLFSTAILINIFICYVCNNNEHKQQYKKVKFDKDIESDGDDQEDV